MKGWSARIIYHPGPPAPAFGREQCDGNRGRKEKLGETRMADTDGFREQENYGHAAQHSLRNDRGQCDPSEITQPPPALRPHKPDRHPYGEQADSRGHHAVTVLVKNI